MPTDPLDGWEINSGLDQMRYRGMPKCVPHNLSGIKACSLNDPAKRLPDVDRVTALSGGGWE